jgi:hypothetical protein
MEATLLVDMVEVTQGQADSLVEAVDLLAAAQEPGVNNHCYNQIKNPY